MPLNKETNSRCLKQFISIPNKLNGFLFKIISPNLNLMYFLSFSDMLLCTVGRTFLGYPQTPSLQLSWWLPCLQNGSPWWSPWAWGKGKVTWSKIRWIGVVPVLRSSSQAGTTICTPSPMSFQTCPNLQW